MNPKYLVFVKVDVIEGSELSQKALLEYDENARFMTYYEAQEFVKSIALYSNYKISDFKILADCEYK